MRILSAGKSYVIPFDNASTVVSPRPTDNGPKGQAGAQLSSIPGATNIDKGILKTDFTAEVLDLMRTLIPPQRQQTIGTAIVVRARLDAHHHA